jgi:FkbM family methyltransferase
MMTHQSAIARRIVAFEPLHHLASQWHENIRLNNIPNAVIFQCALGSSPGTAGFTVDTTTPLNNRFSYAETSAQTGSTSVTVSTIDRVADAIGVERIDLLKIDVEGAEPLVLKGADRLLSERRISTIYMEFIIEFMESFGFSPIAVFESLSSKGYRFFGIDPRGAVGAQLDAHSLIDARRVRLGAPERDFWGLNVIATLL